MFVTRQEDMRGQVAGGAAHRTRGIASGTILATGDGYLPVDFLGPGDRIVTREGMRALRAVRVSRYSGPAVTIRASALGHDRPDQDLTLPADTQVYLRDWRAGAVFGRTETLVAVHRLIDGEFIAPDEVLGLRLYDLVFDAPQIVYAEGVEICCDSVAADAPEDRHTA